jgi:hypothetical protein
MYPRYGSLYVIEVELLPELPTEEEIWVDLFLENRTSRDTRRRTTKPITDEGSYHGNTFVFIIRYRLLGRKRF